MESFKNTIRNKWTKHITARRMRNLWTEYTKVADIKDASLMTQKLNTFLDSFQESYKELLDSGQIKSIDLDKIFGDCSDILVSLLDLVERESNKTTKIEGSSSSTINNNQNNNNNNDNSLLFVVELINKCLNVAELILHDEKYRVVVKDTPNLIYRILALLDTLNTIENKKVLLRVISAVGENTDNKLEIGRLQGFKKLLLLMHNDKELTQEILRTIKHFLDVKQISENEEELLINMKKSLSMSSISEFARHKIGTAVSEGFKVIVGEFQKVFSPNDSDHHGMPRKLSIEKSIIGNDMVMDSFIPSYDIIEHEFNVLINGPIETNTTTPTSNIINSNNLTNQPPSIIIEPEDSDGETTPNTGSSLGNTGSSGTNMTLSASTLAALNEEEVLKEFMRVQGALTSLVNSIKEAALVVQLDLLETISKLLYNNQKNQTEFRNMDGYSILINLFDNVKDFSTPEGKEFLNDCFALIFVIVLDGNKSRRVMNMDALEFLFRVLSTSSQTEVQLQALTCIQDLISINPLNIINIKHIGGIDKLFDLLLNIFKNKKEEEENEMMEKESTKLLLATSELILYLGVLFSKHNCDVFKKYITLMETNPSPPNTLQSLIIQSSITLLSDSIYHKTNVDTDLISSFMKIIQNYQDELLDMINTKKNQFNPSNPTITKIVDSDSDEDFLTSSNEWERKKQSLVDRILLMLELIIMYIKYCEESYREFLSHSEYIKVFVSLAKVEYDQGTSEICDLCLWIINHIADLEPAPYSTVSILVSLLEDSALTNLQREKLCYSIAHMMHYHQNILINNNNNQQQQQSSTTTTNQQPNMLKIRFQEYGGLYTLINIVRNSNTSPSSLVYAALVALCELCYDCEENRMVLDALGYMKLSSLVKSSHIVVDEYLFQLFVEMAMNNSVLIRAQRDYLQQIYSTRINSIVANIEDPQPQYTCILPHSKRQLDIVTYKSMVDGSKRTSQTLVSGQVATQESTQQLYGDEINLGEDNVDFGKESPVSSPSPSLSSSHNHINHQQHGHGNHHQQSSSHLLHPHQHHNHHIQHGMMHGGSQPYKQPHLLAPVNNKSTGIVRVPSFRNLFNGTRRNSIGSWAGSFDDMYGLMHHQSQTNNSSNYGSIDTPSFDHQSDTMSNVSGGSGGGLTHSGGRRLMSSSNNSAPVIVASSSMMTEDKETIYSYTVLGRTRLRSPEAALMLVDLLPQSPPMVQQHNLVMLMKILESNPQNKKMMCAAQGLKFLLYLSHQSPEETQSYYSRLIVILGLYDISPSEVRLLFDLACFPSFESHPQLESFESNRGDNTNSQLTSSKIRKQELQMQVLYVIGTLTERKTPPLYFNFDGFDSFISIGQIDKFPSQRNGYTFSCWIKTNYFLSDESGLFSWQDTSENNIFEVYFKALGRSSDNKRCLCIQTRNYPSPPETFCFDKFAFSECGSWHHVVLTHSKAKIALFVDGRFVQNYSTVNYPRVITKDKPIQGCIGRRIYSIPSANSSSSNLAQLITLAGGSAGTSAPASAHSSFNSLPSLHEIDALHQQQMQQQTEHAGYFCGQMGTVHFFEGCWEAPSCHKVYSRGNLYNNSYKALGIENKEFLVIKPASSPNGFIEPLLSAAALSMSGEITAGFPPATSSSIPISSPPSSPPITRNLSFPGQLSAISSNSPLEAAPGSIKDNSSSLSHSSDQHFAHPQPSSSVESPSSSINSTSSSTTSILKKSSATISTPSKQEKEKEKEKDNVSLGTPTLSNISSTSSGMASSVLTSSTMIPIETQGANVEFRGGVNVHQTRCLKDVIKEVGGIHLCFPFLDMAPAQQVAGLRILAGLLHKSESNKAQFRELHGFSILYHLLLRFSSATSSPVYGGSTELSMETFEILFDLLLDGMNNHSDAKQLWSHDCMTLILDLISGSCSEELQTHVLKYFNNLLATSPGSDTLRLWITNPYSSANDSSAPATSELGAPPVAKINYLLALSLRMEGDCSYLLNIVKKVLPHLSPDDLESVFEYLVYNKEGEYEKISVKSKVFDLIYEEMRKCPALLENLRSLGGFNIVFSMLELPSDEIRVTAIKLIGLLMHSNTKAASLFRRNSGFELLATLLSAATPSTPSMAVCRALLVLIVDGYKFDPKCVLETKQRSSSWISLDFFTRDKSYDSLSSLANASPADGDTTDSGSEKDSNNSNNNNSSNNNNNQTTNSNNVWGKEGDDRTVVYPEAMHTLFLILAAHDYEHANHNVEYQCLLEIERLLDSTINMEIMWNQPWFEWLYQFIEHQGYHLTKENIVYQQTLSLCKKMVMHDINKKTSKIIKVKEVCVDFEEFYVHIVESVLEYFEKDFVLPNNNEASDIIKNLVIYFKSLDDIAVPPDTSMRILNAINQLAVHNTSAIRSTMKSNGLFDIRDTLIIQLLRCDMKNFIVTYEFDFECVVDQRAFRESNNGLLYLLYFFHLSVNDAQIQYVIYGILKNVFGSSDENRKIITNILEDQQVNQMFFDQQHNNNSNNEDQQDAFVEWYYREEMTPKRIEIETRIGKLMAPVETRYNSQQEKLIKAKEKRIKQRKEKNFKQHTTITKLVQETEEKRKARASKMMAEYSNSAKLIPLHSQERRALGKERWDYFKQRLWDSVLWIVNQNQQQQTNQPNQQTPISASSPIIIPPRSNPSDN